MALLTVLPIATCIPSGPPLMAQTFFGGVNGTVSDASGGVVPGARVTLTNESTGIATEAETNARGFFTFVNVRAGQYTLGVTAPGFKAANVPGFPVGVNDTMVQNVTLEVGAVTETVEVTAQATLLQASSSELGGTIEEEVVHDLPLNGRNFTQLMVLNPGINPISVAQGSTTTMGFGTEGSTGIPGSTIANASIQGQQNRSKVYFYDGIINTSIRGTSYTVLPDIDLIQEFKVQSHSDKAEFGSATGGVVNMTSKSGTNDFHGSAFWFVRNEIFDARDPFRDAQSEDPPVFRQNQFGANIGGPIVRNKTFFHGGYDGWRYRDVSNQQDYVPTSAVLNGDFSNTIYNRDIYNPFSERRDTEGNVIRDIFPNRMIPAGLIDPQMQGLAQAYAITPNLSGDPDYNFRVQRPRKHDANNYQIRVDHYFSERDNVFFRWNEQYLDTFSPTGDRSGSTSNSKNRNWGGGLIHMFSPTTILEVRGGAAQQPSNSRSDEHELGIGPIEQLGFQDLDRFEGFTAAPGGEPWSIPSFGIGGPSFRGNPNYSFTSNVTWLRGNHNFKAGFQYVRNDRNQVNTSQGMEFDQVPTQDPQNPGQTGDGLATMLLGLPSRYTGSLGEDASILFYISSWAAFVQDEWKLRPNLTLTYGLRYDYVTRAKNKAERQMQSGPDMRTGEWLIALEELPGPCAVVQASPCIPHDSINDVSAHEFIRVTGERNSILTAIKDNWGPRLGLAWQMDPKTVLRGGYSLTWDAFASRGQYAQHQYEFWGWPQSSGFDTGVVNRLGDPLQRVPDLQGAFPFVQPQPEPWNANGWFNEPGRKDAYSHQWNLEIQRQMSDSLMMAVAYVGSTNGRLEYTGLTNVGAPGPGSPEEVNARRPWPHMKSEFLYETSTGHASYHSFQYKLNKRYSRGLAVLFNYTWSKSIDDTGSGWFGTENGIGGRGLQDFYDQRSNRSVSSYDIPHLVTFGMIWDIPGPRSGAAKAVLGGWQMNWLATARSGQPFTPDVGGDIANLQARSGWNYGRPNLVGDPTISNPDENKWFDANAFSVPSFAFGNSGRNILRAPGLFNADFSLFKKIPLGEVRQLEMRFEAFNVFNKINLGNPRTRIDQSNPGRITSVAGHGQPRQLQFGLRYSF